VKQSVSFRQVGAISLKRVSSVPGVPLDLGASRRGVDMGPSAMRVAGLEARLEALGPPGHRWRQHPRRDCRDRIPADENARYLKEIAETCTRTAEAVVKTLWKRA
jgi:arginase